MFDQQPDPRRSPQPFTLRARVSDPLYRSLAFLAAGRGVSISEVARELLERQLHTMTNRSGESLLDIVGQNPDLGTEPVELDDQVEDADEILRRLIARADAA
jgi:hypothetical protein